MRTSYHESQCAVELEAKPAYLVSERGDTKAKVRKRFVLHGFHRDCPITDLKTEHAMRVVRDWSFALYIDVAFAFAGSEAKA